MLSVAMMKAIRVEYRYIECWMLSIIMLYVTMLSVIMPIVVAPKRVIESLKVDQVEMTQLKIVDEREKKKFGGIDTRKLTLLI
jgi:membrane protein insertase Oxa1/YidC/SpoIIIJ